MYYLFSAIIGIALASWIVEQWGNPFTWLIRTLFFKGSYEKRHQDYMDKIESQNKELNELFFKHKYLAIFKDDKKNSTSSERPDKTS